MTVVFSDGAEDGTTDGFNDVYAPNGTFTATTDEAKFGSYSFEAHLDANEGSPSWAIGYVGSLSNAYNPLYLRAYIRFDVLPEDVNDYIPLLGVWHSAVSSNNCRAGIIRDATGYHWFIRRYDNGGFSNALGSNTPAVDTWYCVELEVYNHNSTGYTKLYINNVSEVESTGLNNSARNLNYAHFGVNYGVAPDLTAFNAYLDNCVVADAYIGLETSIPVLMHHYKLMRKR